MCSSHIKEKYKIKEVFGANFGFKATSKTTTTTKSVHHISSTPIIEVEIWISFTFSPYFFTET